MGRKCRGAKVGAVAVRQLNFRVAKVQPYKSATCSQHNYFGSDNLPHVVNFQATLQLLCNVSYKIANIFIVALDFHQLL